MIPSIAYTHPAFFVASGDGVGSKLCLWLSLKLTPLDNLCTTVYTSIMQNSKVTTTRTFRLANELLKKIIELAEKNGVTPNEYVEKILTHYCLRKR